MSKPPAVPTHLFSREVVSAPLSNLAALSTRLAKAMLFRTEKFSGAAGIALLSFFLVIASSLFSLSSTEREETVRRMREKDFVAYHVPVYEFSWLWTQNISVTRLKKIKPHEVGKTLTHIENISKGIRKSTSEAADPDNLWKNTHFSNLPFDETRTLRNVKGFFISANDVLTPAQSYIISEAPKQSTLPDFWKTILDTDTATVLALAMPDPLPIRYPPYWMEEYLPKSVEDWIITKSGEKVLFTSKIDSSQRIVQRTYRAVKKKEKRTITHLHCENWPDRGAAARDVFYYLLQYVMVNHTNGNKPILVHCVAGIGRSGTFVAAHSLLKDLELLKDQWKTAIINVPQRVVDLRLQRSRTLSTTVQLAAVYDAVQQYIEKKKQAEKSTHGKRRHSHSHSHKSHH